MGNVVKKIVQGINKIDPVQGQLSKLADRSSDNKALAFVMPGAYQTSRVAGGEAITPKLVGDPGSYFKPSQKQQLQSQAQADAEAAAARDALTPPSLDTAANAARQAADRLRRRRGILGNIFGGSSSSTPTVGVKSLLGS